MRKDILAEIFKGDGTANEAGVTLEEFVEGYDPHKYMNPTPTVDTAVFSYKDSPDGGLKILLIKRRNHPSIGFWALPGGFVEMNESIEEAAARELAEETGVDNITPVQVGAFGDPDRDPRTTIITTLYTAVVQENAVAPEAGDDAKDAAFFDIDVMEDGDKIVLDLRCDEKDVSLYARIKKCVVDSGILHSERLELEESNGIAMDHAVLIAEAYRYIRKNLSFRQCESIR